MAKSVMLASRFIFLALLESLWFAGVATASPPSSESLAIRTATRPALAALALLAFAVSIFLAVGRLGFNPTDEGYTLAQTYRLLRGEMPHRDIISPLLMGSPIVHALDFALPLPLLESSRLVAAIEVVTYSAFLAVLALGPNLGRMGLPLVLGAAVSALINLHIFPLIASHTVDGLLFASAGLVLVVRRRERESSTPSLAGFVLLGAAGVMKQSFFLAPLLGLALLWRAGGRRILAAAGAAALPALLYVVVVAAGGGFEEMLSQVGGASPVAGRELLAPFVAADERWRSVALMLLLAALLRALRAIRGTEHARRSAGRPVVLAQSLLALLGTALLVAVPFRAEFLGGTWGPSLVWMVVVTILLDLVVARSVDPVAAILVALAWMTTLSYGYPVPNLVAGSAALYVGRRLWEGVPLPTSLASVAAALGLAVMAHAALAIRATKPYFDRPAPFLTEGLADVAPAFGAIRTNSVTATYLRQLRDCLARYPASRAAILPDNAFAYPVFGLRNALPISWLQWRLTRGSEARLMRAALDLDHEGDYVVLFQTVSAFLLARIERLTDATPASPLPWRGVASTIAKTLDGRRSECGSFIVIHAPRRETGREPQTKASR